MGLFTLTRFADLSQHKKNPTPISTGFFSVIIPCRCMWLFTLIRFADLFSTQKNPTPISTGFFSVIFPYVAWGYLH